MTPLEETTKNQQCAAAPQCSAFVLANAGSGKTRVLTNRVARLLLDQTPPQKILCITFTKAAAAEMAERLFGVLGQWALLDDQALNDALRDLEGDDFKPRDGAELKQARRLFARALETPGGLKIQTIHSFCETTLRRFPLEAGAPPGFQVIEDGDAQTLLTRAIDETAEEARAPGDLQNAFTALALQHTENDVRELLRSGLYQRFDFVMALSEPGSLDAVLETIAGALGADTNRTEDEIIAEALTHFQRADVERAIAAMTISGGNNAKAAEQFHPFLGATSNQDKWNALYETFFVQQGTPRTDRSLRTAALRKHCPWTFDYLGTSRNHVDDAAKHLKAQRIFANTAAYYAVLNSVIDRYEAAKAARAALDFDDLIMRTLTLFRNSNAHWVMYKLDSGIDHILIDEAQDTSPRQWDVVETLFDDFLSGTGARDINRSFFAVGDMKQSIYSFQGADAGLFKTKETILGKRLSEVTNYANVPLQLSFRTTEPVLTFVDAAFQGDAAEGLGEETLQHKIKRTADAGRVELWPLVPRPDKPDFQPWDAPVDERETNHPATTLANKVADQIKTWLEAERPLYSKGRAVTPGDIMILVQSRGQLFNGTIEALATRNVAVAGADRLKLLDDPAVEDFVSFLRFAVAPHDDLSLAEILKSPLFGFDDDADLFALAANRDDGQTLWQALRARADEAPHWRAAVDEISAARNLGLKEGPFAFLSFILGNNQTTGTKASGRKRFYQRLSEASRDAIDETLRQALDFENAHPRNMRAFLAWFETNAGEIKREMDRTHDAVRVMTVHAAKGLEAPIVFLIDAYRPPLAFRGKTLKMGDAAPTEAQRGKFSVLVGPSANDTELTADARAEEKRKRYEEYRRLFYVGATRAEDELYICGIEQGRNSDPHRKPIDEKTWHALAQDAFDSLGARTKTFPSPLWDADDSAVQYIDREQETDVQPQRGQNDRAVIDEPPWLFEPAPYEEKQKPLSPSKLAGEEADGDDEGKGTQAKRTAAYSPTGNNDPYFRGRTLHRLLELLPDLEDRDRASAADRLLERLAAEIPPEERAHWRDEVLTVMRDEMFTDVFQPGSRAEVSVGGVLTADPKRRPISGQIDRLYVGTDRVLIVDYKTNRPPPDDVKDANTVYINQLAAYRGLMQEIYPAHQIDCALLWTYAPSLMHVPSDRLDQAFVRLVRGG